MKVLRVSIDVEILVTKPEELLVRVFSVNFYENELPTFDIIWKGFTYYDIPFCYQKNWSDEIDYVKELARKNIKTIPEERFGQLPSYPCKTKTENSRMQESIHSTLCWNEEDYLLYLIHKNDTLFFLPPTRVQIGPYDHEIPFPNWERNRLTYPYGFSNE